MSDARDNREHTQAVHAVKHHVAHCDDCFARKKCKRVNVLWDEARRTYMKLFRPKIETDMLI